MTASAEPAFAPQSFWRDETLRDWLARAARQTPHAPALLGPGGPLDYATLAQRVAGLAAALRELGIGRGDVIAVQLPNISELVLTYLAAGQLGAVMQTLHMPYRAAELEPLLRHGNAKAFVCVARGKDFSAAELALALRERLPALRHVIAVGDGLPAGALAFPREAAAGFRHEPTTGADRFLLLYTSGTVASPKGVPMTYQRFLANARLSAAALDVTPSSILISAAPFTHLYGLYSVNVALAAGAATALLPVFAPQAFAAALDAMRPSGAFVGPAHLTACLNEGLLTPERLRSLHFVMISGSYCPPELARLMQERMPDGKVLQLWGMSEMQAGSFTRPADPLEARMSSVGRASPGTQLRVCGDDGAVPEGEEGELQVRGASVFDGYLDNAAATAAAFTPDGWFRTGDLARMDADGFVRITGRLKEVINRGGVKFNPADVEAVIGRHAAVAQCAIVPMADAVLGERACCFAVLKPGAELDLDALRGWLTQHGVAKTKWPERLELIDEMPMTPTRKIRKAELVKRLER